MIDTNVFLAYSYYKKQGTLLITHYE